MCCASADIVGTDLCKDINLDIGLDEEKQTGLYISLFPQPLSFEG